MLEIVDPVIQWVFISLDIEYVVSESFALDADLEDWKGVGVEVHPSGEFWENVQVSSSPETVLFGPVSNRISLVELKVVVKLFEVEVDLGSAGVLRVDGQVGSQDASPLWAGDVLVQKLDVVTEGGKMGLEISEIFDIALEFSEGLVVSVIEWGGINIDDSRHSGVVVASGCQGQLSSKSVSSQGGGRNFIFPHESHNVVSHFFHIKAIRSI